MAKIKFNSTLTGAIIDLDVIIQGKLEPSPGFVVTYNKTLTAAALTVVYQISGPNGTAYTIKYSCTSDGVAKSDPNKPTDITGTIISNGFIVETLTIAL